MMWRQLRAVLVTFHILAITLDASPSPAAGLKRAAWADPTVQQEFQAWADRLGVESQTLQDWAWDIANRFADGRQVVMTPFRPWIDATHTTQAWQMFVAPHRFPTRLQIQVQVGETWETVFEERSTTATWRAEAFGTERLRASIFRWGWASYADAWKRACGVFATELFTERPDISAVRCRLHKVRTPSPEDVRDGKLDAGTWVFPRQVERP